jgi:hypothetical protein
VRKKGVSRRELNNNYTFEQTFFLTLLLAAMKKLEEKNQKMNSKKKELSPMKLNDNFKTAKNRQKLKLAIDKVRYSSCIFEMHIHILFCLFLLMF